MYWEKRKVGDYTVLNSINIGGKEIVIGEYKKAQAGQRYLCCCLTNNGAFEKCENDITSDDYAEIMNYFGKYITKEAKAVLKEHEAIKKVADMNKEIGVLDCSSITWEDSIVGKVVVIDSELLYPEYRYASYQLMLCNGGFGAQARARGRTCHCVNLFDQKRQSFNRSDIIGTLEPDNLPAWAKEGLKKVKGENV